MLDAMMTLFVHPLFWLAILFIQYVGLMEAAAKYGKDNIPKIFIWIFVIEDWVMNWMLCFVFFDLPAEWNELVTGRMKRYKKLSETPKRYRKALDNWRYNFSVWLCGHLNRYDKGHC
ncbi:MAG: hypothetical protein R3227_02850 [Reinekea sp.]|nr:hypothetical protein [Reinekea sp.]